MSFHLAAVGPLHPLLQEKLNLFIVHFSYLIGFAVACLLSWFPGNYFVYSSYRNVLQEIIEKDKAHPEINNKEALENEIDKQLKGIDILLAKRIGKLERIFYIYAFMFESLGLLSGWIVLKAFFSWVTNSDDGANGSAGKKSSERALRSFYLYIWGNALSLLLALAMAKLGSIISESIIVTVKLYKELL